MDDTKDRPDLGTINKKRQVLKRCRKITAVLDDVSERYNESIAAVLGNSFLSQEKTPKTHAWVFSFLHFE